MFWKSANQRSAMGSHLSHPMGKPTICICENKDADQLRGNREADQRLCFRYKDSTIPLLLKSEISSFYLFCACTCWFVSDLFGNHIVGFPTRRLIYLIDTSCGKGISADWRIHRSLLRFKIQGPVVQNFVSLTSSLRPQLVK